MFVIGGQSSKINMPSASFKERASNCALLTITIICICILVLCGVMIVREYSLAKDYEPATCKILNITYAKDLTCTFCEAKDKTKEQGANQCKDTRLPCIQIDVIYHLNGRSYPSVLHPDSLQAAGMFSKCSFDVCLKTYELNRNAVEKYAEDWRAKMHEGSSFDCFYKTDDKTEVIVKKMHTKENVIHSMLWPSLVIVICGMIFLKLEMRRRGMGFCETTDPRLRGPRPPGAIDSRNGGSAPGGNPDLKQTLIQVQNDHAPNKVQCSLLKNQGVISSSMPALDRITVKPPGEYSKLRPPSPGYSTCATPQEKGIGASLSVDALRLHQVQSLDETSQGNDSGRHLLSAIPKDKLRQDSTKTDGSSTGSQGSKIMGLETPV